MPQVKFSQNEIDDLSKRDIIDILGLSHLDEKKKAELRGKILETVQKRVMERIVAELIKIGKKEEFDNVPEDESIEVFFQKNNIDTNRLFIEETFFYKSQLATASKMVDFSLDASKN